MANDPDDGRAPDGRRGEQLARDACLDRRWFSGRDGGLVESQASWDPVFENAVLVPRD